MPVIVVEIAPVPPTAFFLEDGIGLVVWIVKSWIPVKVYHVFLQLGSLLVERYAPVGTAAFAFVIHVAGLRTCFTPVVDLVSSYLADCDSGKFREKHPKGDVMVEELAFPLFESFIASTPPRALVDVLNHVFLSLPLQCVVVLRTAVVTVDSDVV